jgi:hypothetical protein
MDVPVDNKIVEYILRCSFREGTIDFEVKDLVKVYLFIISFPLDIVVYLVIICFEGTAN